MSPLALYIEQVSGHEAESPSQHPEVVVYPPSPPINLIFDSLHSAPMLDRTRTNRILVYPGSFNPPHRGHLHLLKHVFMRGTHDMNMIAAIILPGSDKSVAKKVKAEGGEFMFGRDERCLLWKQDLCFPPWAWVYENGTISFTTFSERLIQATKKDGYSLEYVPLYGAGIASPSSPPGPMYGCKTVIMSDAARAADFQRSSGRLRDFRGCTAWRRIRVDEDKLRHHARAKACNALLAMETICPEEACTMVENGPGYVEEITETAVEKAIQEMKAVLACKRQVEGRRITLRFVKCEEIDSRAKYNDISSTIVRNVMSRQKHSGTIKAVLNWMALSADVLWQYKDSWIDKARLRTGCCINFQESTKEIQMSRNPELLEKRPSLKKSRSLGELGLIKAVETTPSIQDLPSLEHSASREQPRSFEEPQSFEQPQPTNMKKRRFSATGLEADVEILDDSVGEGVLEQ